MTSRMRERIMGLRQGTVTAAVVIAYLAFMAVCILTALAVRHGIETSNLPGWLKWALLHSD